MDENEDDIIVTVKLPRAKLELLRKIIAREEAYGWLEGKLKTSWIWVVAGGILSLITFWDKIHAFMIKV